MKIFKLLSVAVIALLASSCGSSYDADKCDEIIDKFGDKEKLTEKDHKVALEQCDAILSYYEKNVEKLLSLAKDKDDKALELFDEAYDENLDMMVNLSALYGILQNEKLKGDQKTTLKDIEKRIQKLGKEEEKAYKSLAKLDKSFPRTLNKMHSQLESEVYKKFSGAKIYDDYSDYSDDYSDYSDDYDYDY